MSKRELINAILEHNQTAAPEFLAKFAEGDLKAYLDRVSVLRTTLHHVFRPKANSDYGQLPQGLALA